MGVVTRLGTRLDDALAARFSVPVPEPRDLGRHVAPLPTWLENVALRLVWVVVAANLLGTVFGFYYYLPQLSATPPAMWPIVPVSPLATLYMAISLTAWRLGYSGRVVQLVHVLAVLGCLKYGLWSVVVQLFIEDTGPIPFLVWQFLVWSHAAMALQAFLVQRYAAFPRWAIVVGVAWYTLNDVLDFFVAVAGGPHHTWVNVLYDEGFDRTLAAFDHMAGAAVVATVLATVVVFLTHAAILESRLDGSGDENRDTVARTSPGGDE